MDVRYSDDQVEIARQARRFFENECPIDYVRTMFEDERGFTEDLWKKMAEMGWMGMLTPEDYGGLGMDMMDLAVVMQEMGRALFPGPFFSTVLPAAQAVMEAGSDDQKNKYLPGIAAGEMRGAAALQEPDSGADLGHIQMEARSNGDGFVLNGTKLFVPDAHCADFLVCPARTIPGNDPSQGITLFLVDPSADGVSVTALPTMDGTRKLSSVEFKDVKLGPEDTMGEVDHGWAPLCRALQKALVGLSAECVGGAERALEIAVDYAKIRVQFDQPIGSYQAIKHRCARMFEDVESARSILLWAAWAQDQGEPEEAAISASAVKSYCSEVFTRVSTSAIQVLGGTGFSWEHDIHLYLKRAKANEMALGDPTYHREQVAQMLSTKW
jgi:alkylation response protein AidB-like acyl-CoA dehydrogenase